MRNYKIVFVVILFLGRSFFTLFGQTHAQFAYEEKQNSIVIDSKKPIQKQIKTGSQLYEIRDDLNLDGETIKLPNGCHFCFNGGIVKNGIIETDCLIVNEWGFDNVKIKGNVDFSEPIVVPVENAKDFISTIIEYKPIVSDYPTVFVFSSNRVYSWEGELRINKKNITLTGGGTIEGHIHIGLDDKSYKKYGFDTYPSTAHSNVIISNLRFSKHSVIRSYSDSEKIIEYIKKAEPISDNIAISIINISNVKIEGCFFDNVPYPIVYTPNKGFVNQNVRRLNVINCDFEFCHTAVYAPSIVKNSLEYGDLLFSNNNVYPTNYGLDVSCIDGLKVFNNTFNTCKNGQMGANIRAYLPGQVVITNNSFYGEYNSESVILDSPGTALIDGNLFSSQGIDYSPSKNDRMACLRIQRTDKTTYTSGLAITNNLFTRVNRLPIFADGYFRSTTIMGNTVSGTRYTSNKRVIYYYHSTSNDEVHLQPMRMNDNIMEDVTGTLTLRMDVINDMLNSNGLYPDEIWRRKKHTYTIKKGNEYIPVSVIGCSKTKPIYAVSPIHSTSYSGNVPFIFNGLQFSISVSSSTSDSQVLNRIVEVLKPVFGETHQFKIIDNILWIVGKNSDVPVITPMSEINDQTSSYRFNVLYQNLGYSIIVKDEDEKNFINTPLYDYGIDQNDDGKIVRFGDVLTVLRVKKTDRQATMVFKDRPQKRGSNKWLYNDMFFACGEKGTLNTSQLLSQIVTLCYSDRALVRGNSLVLKESGNEYNHNSSGQPWYSIYNKHVVDYVFLTDHGVEYNPDTGSFNNVGKSSSRPTNPKIGFQYFDTDLGIPIFWNGAKWVDYEGKLR